MAQSSLRELSGFSGEVSSVDISLIPPNAASEAYNVDVRDSKIKVRLGHTQLSAAPGGFSSSLGFDYVSGYNDSYVFAEEIITFDARSGPIYRPYSVDVLTGVRTEIKDGVTSVSLANAFWSAIGHEGYAYCFPRRGAAYRHIVGDATSWEAVDAPDPDDLAGSVPLSGTTTEDTSTVTDGTTESFATVVGGDFSNLSNTTFNAVNGTGFDMDKTATGHCVFQVQLPSTPLDLSGVSGFRFTLTIPGQPLPGYPPFGPNPFSFAVKLIDALANDVDMDVSVIHNKTAGTFNVEARYPEGSTPSEFADADAVEIDFLASYWIKVASTYIEQTFTYTVSELTFFVDGTSGDPTPSGSVERVRFGIAGFNEERNAESENVLPSAWVQLDSSPTRWFSDADDFLGNQISVVLPTPSSPATHTRVYVQFEEENVWRLVDTVADAGDYLITLSSAQLHELPERYRIVVVPVGNVLCAVAHGGSIVWGGEGGKENIKISAIGNPGAIASLTDDLDDATRGATFTMADNFADEPVAMLSIADGLFIFGGKGVYAMQGLVPTQMTPPKKFTQGLGIISPKACAVFVDNGGNPSAIYIDVNQQIWLLQIVNGLSEYGLRSQRFDSRVEGLCRSWLTQVDTPTGEDLAIVQDRANDAVHICYQGRMLVLSRRALISGERQWVRHAYSSTWKRFAAEDSRFWAISSTGAISQMQKGTTDNGVAIASAYWESGDMKGPFRRLSRVMVDKEVSTKTVTVTATADNVPGSPVVSSAVIGSNVRHGRFPTTQLGFRHRVKVALTSIDAVITRLVIEEYGPLGRKLMS